MADPLPEQLSVPEGPQPKDIWLVGRQPLPQEPDTNLVDQFRATWIDNYGVAAAQVIQDNYANKPLLDALAEDDYDPTPFLTPEERGRGEIFGTARSPLELEFLRDRVRKEEEARAALANGPWNPIVVSLLGSLADPLTYIPLAGQAAKGLQGAKLATRLAVAGATTAADVAVGEAFAQQSQYTRTATESALAVMFSGTMAMGLGAAGAAAGAAGRKVASEWAGHVDQVGQKYDPGSTAGAAQRGFQDIDAADNSPVAAGFARALAKIDKVAVASPNLVLATSRFSSVRAMAHKLADTGVMARNELGGFTNAPGGTLDFSIRRRVQEAYNVPLFTKRAYKAARGAGYQGGKKQFKADVTTALAGGRAASKEVEATAREIRNVLDKYAKEYHEVMQATGQKVEPQWGSSNNAEALWGLAQRFDHRKVVAKPREFDQAIRASLRESADKQNADIDAKLRDLEADLQAKFGRTIDEQIKFEKAKTDAKAKAAKAAGETFNVREATTARKVRALEKNRLTEDDVGELARDVRAQASQVEPTGRTTKIKTEFSKVQPKGVKASGVYLNPDIMKNFLVSDTDEVVMGFVRKMAPEIEARKKFGTMDITATREWEAMQAEFSKAQDAAKSEKEAKALQAEFKRQKELLEDGWTYVTLREPFRKTRERGRAIQAVLRSYAYMRMLGGVVVSSLPDPSRVMHAEGALQMMRHLGAAVPFSSGFQASKRVSALANTAFNSATNAIGRGRYDLGDPYAAAGPVERAMNVASSYFSTATGLPIWTDYWQRFHTTIAETRVLETARKYARAGNDMAALTEFERMKLAQDGLTPGHLAAIAAQEANWTREVGAGISANVEKWTDLDARDAFLNALFREGETGVYNPGVMDKPLWTSDPAMGGLGKSVSQFKSYSMTAMTRILLATAQYGAAGWYGRIAASTMFAIMTGMAAQRASDWAFNREPEERGLAEWINIGIDRSGILGMYYELESVPEWFGFSPSGFVTTGDPTPRYRDDLPRTIAGPAVSTIAEAADTMANTFKYGADDETAQDFARLLPLRNYVWMHAALQVTNQALGEQ